MVCTPNTNGVTLTAPESSTGTGAIYRQIIEPEQVARLAGKTITFSFMATNRGSAGIYMRCLTPASVGDTPNIASGETKIVTKTVTLAADITELQLVFRKSAGTLDIDINWAKLEIGSVATEFSPPSIAEELIKCQRYYRKYLGGVSGISLVGEFYAASTTAGYSKIYLGNMRSTPTIAISNIADIKIGFSTATFESTVVNKMQYNDITKDMSIYKAYITGTGFVAGQAYFLGIAKDGYIAFDAEL